MSERVKCPSCGSLDIILVDGAIRRYQCHSCLHSFQKDEKSTTGSSHCKAPSETKLFFDRLMNKVVALNAYFEREIAAGTGFFVSQNCILTNAHVFMRPRSDNSKEIETAISITGSDYSKKKQYVFEILTTDYGLDIAILRISKGTSEYVSFANNIYNGEQVYAIGNSHGEGLCIQEGIVSDVHRLIDGHDYFMTTALATKGNSGCPVFNPHGQLLGMITEGSKLAISMIYAIPYQVLIDFVKRFETKQGIQIL